MILGITVDLSALPCFLRPFPSPHRAGVPSRLVLVSSHYASRRRAVSRGSVRSRSEMRVEAGSERLSSSARPSGRRGRLESEARPSGRRGGPESEASERRFSLARPSGRRLDRSSGPSLDFLGRPRSCASFAIVVCWAELLLGIRSMRDPGFMNPTEPLRKLKGKQELVATDKDHFSIMLRGGWGNRPYKP